MDFTGTGSSCKAHTQWIDMMERAQDRQTCMDVPECDTQSEHIGTGSPEPGRTDSPTSMPHVEDSKVHDAGIRDRKSGVTHYGLRKKIKRPSRYVH